MTNTEQNNIIVPTTPRTIRSFMDRAGLDLIPNNNLSDDHLLTIMRSLSYGLINTEEKNQLLITIILNQLKTGKYLGGIKHKEWCSNCKGKGFRVILETKLETDPCIGDMNKNAMSCNGSGIKTSPCNRCGGLKLGEILRIRNDIMIGTSDEITRKYNHFAKIKVDKISHKFIEINSDKTFRIFRADKDGNNNAYYYIPKSSCKTCNGTGNFIHDRKNIKCTSCDGSGHDTFKNECETCHGKGRINGEPIKCPGCHGKGHRRKQLVTTNNVKSFIVCGRCEGLGTIPINPVINIKTIPKDVKIALKKSGLLK